MHRTTAAFPRRLPLVLLLFATLASMISCSQEVILHGLTEGEANDVLVALEDQGLAPRKVAEEGGRVVTYQIRIAPDEAAAARRHLKANNLPQRHDPGLNELFGGDRGLIPSEVEEKAKLIMGLGGELAATLKSVPGILDARVHVTIPEENPLRDEGEPAPEPTAAVWYKYGGADGGDLPLSIEETRHLVAGSVQGLHTERVTVVTTPLRPEIQDDGAAATTRCPPITAATTRIMGVEVAPGSSGLFRLLMGGGLFLVILLAGADIFCILRLRALRQPGQGD